MKISSNGKKNTSMAAEIKSIDFTLHKTIQIQSKMCDWQITEEENSYF